MKRKKNTLFILLFAALTAGAQAQTMGNNSTSNGNQAGSMDNRSMGNGNVNDNIIVGDQTDYGIDPDVVVIDVDDPIDIRPYNGGNAGDHDVIIEEVVITKSYNAVFTLSRKGKTATTAEKNMNLLIKSLKSQMNRLGISSDEISAEFISFVPVYELVHDNVYQQGDEKTMTGFELKQRVRIHFGDFNLLQGIIKRAAAIGIDHLDKVEHIVERNMH
jgi:hypothetical protein